ncbi:uncharacterized protein LOC117584657 [Drosophila guanche]|uniref:Uncharacterized protein n=1 Tax=Drosophila guanche TaxID=7266 RepID=A0A3B0JU13_DROGU|nr:uncharacterized protein LOC117584657 [Drosophila guanche]SPP74568.1 Hypothetical predicted protein [Drosophila guanche]
MHYTSVLLLVLPLVILELCAAKPWWPSNDVGYDASLDPVAWSRAFVQEKVRTSRRNKNRHQQSTGWWYHTPTAPEPTAAPLHFVDRNNYRRFLKRRRKLAARERHLQTHRHQYPNSFSYTHRH